MKKIIIFAALLLAGFAGTAQKAAVVTSDKSGWQKIAETVVSFDKEKDQVLVLGADRFAAIRFRVTDAPIHFNKLEVYYESGDMQEINVNKMVSKEKESMSIDLNGGERSLKKVVFYYRTQPNSADKKARMELWGLKTNTDKR